MSFYKVQKDMRSSYFGGGTGATFSGFYGFIF